MPGTDLACHIIEKDGKILLDIREIYLSDFNNKTGSKYLLESFVIVDTIHYNTIRYIHLIILLQTICVKWWVCLFFIIVRLKLIIKK